jgi:hypothetical protein
MISQSVIDALVEQNPHSGFRRQKLLSFLERGDGHLAGDPGKPFQKFFECLSALQ